MYDLCIIENAQNIYNMHTDLFYYDIRLFSIPFLIFLKKLCNLKKYGIPSFTLQAIYTFYKKRLIFHEKYDIIMASYRQ